MMCLNYEYEQSAKTSPAGTLVLHHFGPLTLDSIAIFHSMLTMLCQILFIDIEGPRMSDSAKL